MRTILQIGSYQYLLKPGSKIEPLVNSLQGAVLVDEHFHSGKSVFAPSVWVYPTVSIQLVQDDQISHGHREAEPIPVATRRPATNGSPKLLTQ